MEGPGVTDDDTAADVADWFDQQGERKRQNVPVEMLDALKEKNHGGLTVRPDADLDAGAWVWWYLGQLAAYREAASVVRTRFDADDFDPDG